jgi:hypothetical protein
MAREYEHLSQLLKALSKGQDGGKQDYSRSKMGGFSQGLGFFISIYNRG